MDAVLERLKKKDRRDVLKGLIDGVSGDVLPAVDQRLAQHLDVREMMESAQAREDPVVVRDSNILAYSIDRILEDSSVMAFFIHFLESCDKLNLIKFWIHVSGFKASFGYGPTGSSQKAEQSLALLDARNIYDRYIDKESSSSICLPKSISGHVLERLRGDCIAPDIFDEAKNFVRDFIDDHHDRDCIQFLLACNTFESSYDKLSSEELLEDAMCVYDRNLAEVDCMGQYHVLYDDSLAQDSTTPSRLRQKLRKYLDKSALEEEEVAVEVARTIIADIHNMVEAGRRYGLLSKWKTEAHGYESPGNVRECRYGDWLWLDELSY
ncbi:regulator of G protein signaling domain protein [Ancylostoma ceylanicum]|uniref:Regulator of G protein signaling domain protein n=1 Tax=Ancylostoma ceylanicum TaxID=53326 RepID=A0A0D6LR21_9BILA|nr:regulator of G protein signaling domain protein [Ancylostoma ceylanicum]